MQQFEPLEQGFYYHIYNRGVNKEDLFKIDRNYPYFLKLLKKFTEGVIDIISYCLIPNHFHLLIGVKKGIDKNPSRQLSHVFNSYTQSINKATSRSGPLFERPFKRKIVEEESYFTYLVYYIHANPIKHGFNDFTKYKYSSYLPIIENTDDLKLIDRNTIIEWFGSLKGFRNFHSVNHDMILDNKFDEL